MTETPNPSPLEEKVIQPEKNKPTQVERPTTLADLTGGLAKGILPLATGASAGYWATGGPGGFGVGLFITSLGMAIATYGDNSRSSSIADFCYTSGFFISLVAIAGALYANT